MPPKNNKTKDNEKEKDHICVQLIINDENHSLYLLNGRSFSVPISSLGQSIETLKLEKDQLKGAIVECIIDLDEGRPFPVQCEIILNTIFKYKLCKVF